jgi:hypothetical protein
MYYLCTYITIVERKRKYAYEAGVQHRCRGRGSDYGGGHGYGIYGTTVDVTIMMTYFMWHPSVPKITEKIHIRVMNFVEGSFAKTVATRN